MKKNDVLMTVIFASTLLLLYSFFWLSASDGRIIRPIIFKSDQIQTVITAEYDHSIYPMFCDHEGCFEYAYLMYYHDDTMVTLLCEKHMKDEK